MTPTWPRPEYVRIHADVPRAAMWTYYRMLEVPETAARLAPADVTHASLVAVRDTIRQARAYFEAAHASPMLTRPVLSFYGMVSLVKLMLLLDRNEPLNLRQIEEVERRGHGLKQLDLGEGEFRLESAEVEVTGDRASTGMKPRGMFPLLARAVTGPSAEAWLGSRVTVMQVVRSIPQLSSVLDQTFGPGHGYLGVPASHHTNVDGSVDIHVAHDSSNDLASAEGVLRRAPYLTAIGAQVKDVKAGRGGHVAVSCPADVSPYSLANREEFAGEAAALPPGLHGHRFDSLLASYMLMYALSIVARYKPDRWARILDGQDSSLLPAIEFFVPMAERWWPNLVLNRVTGKWLRFGQPSYW